MSHVFISYSQENREYVRRLADYLTDHGFDVWIDDRIPYGAEWLFALEEAITASGAMIVVMTPQSRDSRWVRLEIQWAISQEKPIFPLLLAGNLWNILSPYQALPVHGEAFPPDQFLATLATHCRPHRGEQGTNIAPPPDESSQIAGSLDDMPFPVPPGIDPGSLNPTVEIKPDKLHLEMIVIPAGRFQMGTQPEQLPNITDRNVMRWARQTEQARELVLPTYKISKHPITVHDYRLFVKAGGYHLEHYWTPDGWQHRRRGTWEYPVDWSLVRDFDLDQMPVVGLSWYEADAFCRWLSDQSDSTYTLPGEAEWEKAARGPDGHIFPWGNEWLSGRCNTIDANIEADERTNHHRQIEPVGTYPEGSSVYGVADMSGNVWEWCADVFQMVYDPERSLSQSDRAPRVVRGGAYYMPRHFARAAYRHKLAAFSRLKYVGFRVCEWPKPLAAD